ncbi:Sperm-associated antigen 17 [Paramuricea clavata]|uniref:Sperm-associated antigen 17 n=1 Tax=Paramuricea clavata TaxID=317549 RepID=A0A6S7HAF9_PARCT|nr:Sperm-associated antigen 17 [Paramuricea clavata]
MIFCCELFATNWLDVFPERFLPPPAVYEYTANGLKAVEPSEHLKDPKKFIFADLEKRLIIKNLPAKAKEFKQCPLDLYCPSMQEKLMRCVCEKCGSYWPSEAAKHRHKKSHSVKESAACQAKDSDTLGQDDVEEDVMEEEDNGSASHAMEICSDVESESNCIMPVIENLAEFLNSPFVEK